ncbi:uncharacterized protein LOC119340288 [Triticum dicoccoides]|uniref:uncharacterized protein LOC119340288 n=1 Tax=Triticum dicoccoides TaxID=85692 RepID=UPI001891D01C|nr:uncharacterized protein LOC119340288 [Triticum dicoccoides]
MEASDSNQEPEHLIVLVHGIMQDLELNFIVTAGNIFPLDLACPSDWTYGEAVLKKRLGDNFFIYGLELRKENLSHKRANNFFGASSSNIYAKTFDGIDVAGRRLAKEVCGGDYSLLFMY